MDPDECLKEWADLVDDYKNLEKVNREYLVKLEEISDLQGKCMKELNHQRYRMSGIWSSLKKLEVQQVTSANDERVAKLEKEMMKRKAMLHEIEETLPKRNSTYLKIILGNVNVSILNKNDKFKYKDEYEKFKLVLSAIAFVLAVLNIFINFRPLELILIFLLVWYYCTLTIRESILKVNGSRIKGWWRLHHFISTAVSGVILIWPQNVPWTLFRHTFMYFIAYISVVQYLQFRYQHGVLYRLKALGARHNMDITIEGFHSWMWRGLSYLLPFLFGGYLFQLYIAYTLFDLSYHPESTWQVTVLSVLFCILFFGNTRTIFSTVRKKLRSKLKLRYRLKALAKKLSDEFTMLGEQKWRLNRGEKKGD